MIKARVTSHYYNKYIFKLEFIFKGKSFTPEIKKCRKMTPCKISSVVGTPQKE